MNSVDIKKINEEALFCDENEDFRIPAEPDEGCIGSASSLHPKRESDSHGAA